MSGKALPVRCLAFVASAELFFYALLWLIVLLVVGTIAQKWIGLHQSQLWYFSSWWIEAWGIPLPGGRLTMTVAAVNLVAKLALASPLRWNRVGTLVAHVGALLLLLGGLLTAFWSAEGAMYIPEGQARSHFEDYHYNELAVIKTSDPDTDKVTVFYGNRLEPGRVLTHASLPGRITVLDYQRNADLVDGPTEGSGTMRGLAAKQQLRGKNLDPEDRNRAGILLRWEGIDADSAGTWLLHDTVFDPQVVEHAGAAYQLIIRRRRHRLPVAIKLDDFQKEEHPGTRVARSYRSIVQVKQGGTDYRAVIQMNEPLRVGPYTFFQSSFEQGPMFEATVLAVVRNAGRQFPYISSIVICIGLLLHVLVTYLPRMRQARELVAAPTQATPAQSDGEDAMADATGSATADDESNDREDRA